VWEEGRVLFNFILMKCRKRNVINLLGLSLYYIIYKGQETFDCKQIGHDNNGGKGHRTIIGLSLSTNLFRSITCKYTCIYIYNIRWNPKAQNRFANDLSTIIKKNVQKIIFNRICFTILSYF